MRTPSHWPISVLAGAGDEICVANFADGQRNGEAETEETLAVWLPRGCHVPPRFGNLNAASGEGLSYFYMVAVDS